MGRGVSPRRCVNSAPVRRTSGWPYFSGNVGKKLPRAVPNKKSKYLNCFHLETCDRAIRQTNGVYVFKFCLWNGYTRDPSTFKGGKKSAYDLLARVFLLSFMRYRIYNLYRRKCTFFGILLQSSTRTSLLGFSIT